MVQKKLEKLLVVSINLYDIDEIYNQVIFS